MGQTFLEFAEAWSDAAVPAERSGDLMRAVRALVRQTPVRTMAHVDALIALHRSAPRPCTLAELADAARVPLGTVARRCADELVDGGLAARVADRDAYRYAPVTPSLRAGADALIVLRERQGTLVRLLTAYAAEPPLHVHPERC
jgi:hypothetical protein